MQLPLIQRQQHPARWRRHSPMIRRRSSPAAAGEIIQFGRFQLLLRPRQLLADGEPIELGTRAFDLLLVLLEADGSLVPKDELLRRVWPGVFVAEENLKVQISALRKSLGEDRDFIRTDVGRGYRFAAATRSTSYHSATRQREQSRQRWFPEQTCRRSLKGW